MLRPHEHDVLEQVGESRPPHELIPRPDMVPGIDSDYRRRVIFVQDDLETVSELVLLELDSRDGLSEHRICRQHKGC